jgi:peptidoglycan L-alanyl-D-glutamate endopeptidase CwlK
MPAVNRSLNALYPRFSEKVKEILGELNHWCAVHRPGAVAVVTETFRTTARQQELYAQGRTTPGSIVTHRNGTTSRSNHQSALAADFALSKDGKGGRIDWDDEEFWRYLGHLARKHGLTWGGDWTSPVDKPHVEWPQNDKETYRKAREWLKAQGFK